MTQINLTLDEAMDAVFSEFTPPPIEPDEFTIRMYADKYSMPTQTAARRLKCAAKSGRLSERWVSVRGRNCWAYRLVTK